MATKKTTHTARVVEKPEGPLVAKITPVETAEQKLGVMRVLKPDAYGNNYAACGNCGCRLVNVEERVKCRYCWYCGTPVRWK